MQPVPTRMALVTTAVVLGSLGTVSAVGLQAAQSPLGSVPGTPEAALPPHLSTIPTPKETPIAAPPLSEPPSPAHARELADLGAPSRHNASQHPTVLRDLGLRGVDRTVGRVGRTVDHTVHHVPDVVDHALRVGRGTPVSQISEQVRREVVRGIRRGLHASTPHRAAHPGQDREVLASKISEQFQDQARRAVSGWYGEGWQAFASGQGYVGRHRLEH